MEKVEEDMIQNAIAKLVQYALAANLIEKEDALWTANRLLAVMKLDELSTEAEQEILSFDEKDGSVLSLLPQILDQLCDAGVVGEEEGTKPRKVLMSMEQFENYLEEN